MARSLCVGSLCTRALIRARAAQTELRTTNCTLAQHQQHSYAEIGRHDDDDEVPISGDLTGLMKVVGYQSSDDIIIRENQRTLYSRYQPRASCLNTDSHWTNQRSALYRCRPLADESRSEWIRYNIAMKYCPDEIFHCTAPGAPGTNSEADEHAKLYEMRDYLAEHLRKFFVKMHNYSIYHKDVILENNYFQPSVTYRGINAYAMQVNKIRWMTSFRYAQAKFQILKITANEADHSIRVRWRITGLPNIVAFLKFWKFFPGRFKANVESESDWHDGYSTFYLGKDGFIHKHRIDRVIEDEDVAVVDEKTGLAAKLTTAAGFMIGLN